MFFDIFVGEFLEFTTSEYVEGVYYDEQGGPIQVKEPITVTGYLLDIDEERYLIGQKADEVDQSINIDRVWRIRMIDPQNLIEETLKKFPVPKNSDEVN